MVILGRGQPNPTIIGRSSLQDDPVLTTPAPIVEVAPRHPAWLPPPTSPIIGRSSLADVVIPAVATPAAVVLWVPPKPQPAVVIVRRGSLADDPALTTPWPVVVATPRWRPPTYPILSRSSLVDVVVQPVSVGVLTATDAVTATLTVGASGGQAGAADTSGQDAATDTLTGRLTASDQAGGPS